MDFADIDPDSHWWRRDATSTSQNVPGTPLPQKNARRHNALRLNELGFSKHMTLPNALATMIDQHETQIAHETHDDWSAWHTQITHAQRITSRATIEHVKHRENMKTEIKHERHMIEQRFPVTIFWFFVPSDTLTVWEEASDQAHTHFPMLLIYRQKVPELVDIQWFCNLDAYKFFC